MAGISVPVLPGPAPWLAFAPSAAPEEVPAETPAEPEAAAPEPEAEAPAAEEAAPAEGVALPPVAMRWLAGRQLRVGPGAQGS